MQSQDYYPFGLTFGSYQREHSLSNQYQYNSKEVQKELNIGWIDYGARMYMSELGRWNKIDNKSELYFATSPFTYALNQPTNAVDPNGNLVIFINGNHFGSTGPEYWRQYSKVKTGIRDLPDPYAPLGKMPIYETREQHLIKKLWIM